MKDHRTLRLEKPMMHGSAVRRLQELTDLLGYDLGTNDGIYGPQTAREVELFQAAAGLDTDGVCGPLTWGALLAAVDRQEPVSPFWKNYYDIRGQHPRPKWYKRRRSPASVTGVVIHQTGCAMPSNPRGWSRLNAHIGVLRNGSVVFVNDPVDWIWHAQGLSRQTIGIEIAGNYPGLIGKKQTLWKGGGGPHRLTQDMLLGLERVFVLLHQWFQDHGVKWQHVYAHRQSKDTRIADPGEEIWKAVGLPWAKRLQASDGGPAFKKGTGRPVPRDWDAERAVRYW